jgi:DNA-binding CsgD family transcriptional regulator
VTAPDDPRVLERRAQVSMLSRLGWSAGEIAAAVGISERTVTRHRVNAGISRANPPRLSVDELRAAREWLEGGCSYSEAARTLGRDPRTLARRLPGYGWDHREGGQFGSYRRWMRYRAPALAEAI